MGGYFVFSIKVSLCLIAFYLVHKLLFKNEKLHAFNRAMLLSIIGLSVVVPCVKIVTTQPNVINDGMVQIENLIISSQMSDDEQTSQISWLMVMFIIYIIGVATLLVRELWGVIRLKRIITNGRIAEELDGAKVVVMDGDSAPFSWFGYVLISEKDYSENRREILLHEIAHIRYCHSIDVLLCNLLIVFQWYNPAAWLIKRELQDVHEFEADEAVLKKGVDAKQYQMLLIKKSVGDYMFSMANNLNHNSLKRRIKMMKTEKTNRWHCIKAFAILPVAAIAVMAFANPKVEAVAMQTNAEANLAVEKLLPNNEAASVETLAVEQKATDEQSDEYSMVDENPEFPGGMQEMIKYLSENIKYPKEAKEKGIQGRVITQFVVKKDGSIADVKVMRGVDPQLDAEAVRVVEAMPKWKPGKHQGKLVNVKFTLPIAFKFNAPVEPIKNESGEKAKDKVIYIDGKKVTEQEMKNLDPERIESVTVLKNEQVEKAGYGKHDGAIIIKLKK